ncbi:MAG: hypothetical protein LIO71_03270 [Ruminococcus sp.]|nr:hypothetical protein [Ruminococcus sp.]
MSNYVRMMQGKKSDFEAMESYDSNTIYFCVDSQEIYLGNIRMGCGKPDLERHEARTPHFIEMFNGEVNDSCL